MRISSNGSSLWDVLSTAAGLLHAKLDVPPGAGADRVAVKLGPARTRQVLIDLLNGSEYDYIILGKGMNDIQQITLLPRGVLTQSPPAQPAQTTKLAGTSKPENQKTEVAMLTIVARGKGTGKFYLNPPGSSCFRNCTGTYPVGSTVVVTAEPDQDSVFDGWTWCDSDAGVSCTVKVSPVRAVVGTFSPNPESTANVGFSRY
jgi:hypothetical protein